MRTFSRYAMHFIEKNALNVMWEIVERFWGEIKQGEHDGLNNRAAALTELLKTALNHLG